MCVEFHQFGLPRLTSRKSSAVKPWWPMALFNANNAHLPSFNDKPVLGQVGLHWFSNPGTNAPVLTTVLIRPGVNIGFIFEFNRLWLGIGS